MIEYVGKCPCGGIEVRLRSALAPSELQPRTDAQTCAFCEKHDGVWISDPNGALLLRAADRTRVETFASRRVSCHFCDGCGALAYATFEGVAVARLALFDAIRSAAPPPVATSFEGESLDAGRARRLAKWTPTSTV